MCNLSSQKKKKAKAHQQEQIYSRDTCPPKGKSDMQWARFRTTGLNSNRAAQSELHSHNIQHVTTKKSPGTIERGRIARSSQIRCVTVFTSYWQLGTEHLLLHVILPRINLLEPGHLKHAVGCVSREARSHALEGMWSCSQPWSKFEHIH